METTKLVCFRIPIKLLYAIERSFRKSHLYNKFNLSKSIINILEGAMSVELDILNGWERLNSLSYQKQLEVIKKVIDVDYFIHVNYAKKPTLPTLVEDLKQHCEEEISNFFINAPDNWAE